MFTLLRISFSNMVADKEKEKNDIIGLPMFDSTNVVTWSTRLKLWLMRKGGITWA